MASMKNDINGNGLSFSFSALFYLSSLKYNENENEHRKRHGIIENVKYLSMAKSMKQ